MIRKVLFLGISREVRSELPYCESTTESALRLELLQVVLLELVRDEDPSLVEERQRDDGLGDADALAAENAGICDNG